MLRRGLRTDTIPNYVAWVRSLVVRRPRRWLVALSPGGCHLYLMGQGCWSACQVSPLSSEPISGLDGRYGREAAGRREVAGSGGPLWRKEVAKAALRSASRPTGPDPFHHFGLRRSFAEIVQELSVDGPKLRMESARNRRSTYHLQPANVLENRPELVIGTQAHSSIYVQEGQLAGPCGRCGRKPHTT
jgi:hypothetical protein